MTENSLRRRGFLAALGTGAVAVISGCTGGRDGSGTPTESPTPSSTPTPTTPNEEVVEHYQAAIDTPIDTKEPLDEWAASSFESDKVRSLSTTGAARGGARR